MTARYDLNQLVNGLLEIPTLTLRRMPTLGEEFLKKWSLRKTAINIGKK